MMLAPQRIAVAAGLLLAASSLAMAQTSTTTNPKNAPSSSAKSSPMSGSSSSGWMTGTQAKQALEKHGYSQITGLYQAKDGDWMGHATKNGKSVGVTVHPNGHVTQG